MLEDTLGASLAQFEGIISSVAQLKALLLAMAQDAATDRRSASALLVVWLQQLGEAYADSGDIQAPPESGEVMQMKSVVARVHQFIEERGMAEALRRCFEAYCRHGCSAEGPPQLGLLPQGFYKFVCDCKLLGSSSSGEEEDSKGDNDSNNGYLGYEHVDIIFLSCLGKHQSQLRKGGRMSYQQFIAAVCQAVYRRSGLGTSASDNHYFGAVAGTLCTHIFPLCHRNGYSDAQHSDKAQAIMSELTTIATMLEEERPMLGLLFSHYCDVSFNASADSQDNQNLDLKELFRFCTDFRLTPLVATRREISRIFSLTIEAFEAPPTAAASGKPVNPVIAQLANRIKASANRLKAPEIRSLLNKFDRNKTGTLTKDEFTRLLRRLPNLTAISDGDVQKVILHICDSRQLDIEQFQAFVKCPPGTEPWKPAGLRAKSPSRVVRHGASPRRTASPKRTRHEAVRFKGFLEVLVRCVAHRMPANRLEDDLARRLRGVFKHLKNNSLLRNIWADLTVRPSWDAIMGPAAANDDEEDVKF